MHSPRATTYYEKLIRERFSLKSSVFNIISQLEIFALTMPYLTLWGHGTKLLSFFTTLRKYILGINIRYSEPKDWSFMLEFLVAMLCALEIAWWTSKEIMDVI